MRIESVTTESEKQQRDDDKFAARVGEKLRSSVDELDAATLSRLNRSRQAALDAMGQSAVGKKRRNQWLPAGVAAAVAIVAVAFWQRQIPAPDVGVPLSVADEVVELDLLFHEGDLEMYADLEFFAWLTEEELESIG